MSLTSAPVVACSCADGWKPEGWAYCSECYQGQLESLRAERDDLTKANQLLHGFLSNREAELELIKTKLRLSETAIDTFESDRIQREAELESLRAKLREVEGKVEHYEWGRKNTQIEMDEREAEIDRCAHRSRKCAPHWSPFAIASGPGGVAE